MLKPTNAPGSYSLSAAMRGMLMVIFSSFIIAGVIQPCNAQRLCLTLSNGDSLLHVLDTTRNEQIKARMLECAILVSNYGDTGINSKIKSYFSLNVPRVPHNESIVRQYIKCDSLTRQKKYDDAITETQKLINMHDAADDTLGLGGPYYNICDLYYRTGKFREWLTYLQEKEKYYSIKGPYVNLGAVNHRLGRYYLLKGDYNEAISHYMKAGEILRSYYPLYYTNEMSVVANLYMQWPNLERAKYYSALALQYSRRFQSNPNLIYNYYNLADLYFNEGNYSMASSYLDSTTMYPKAVRSKGQEMQIALLRARIYINTQQCDSAKRLIDTVESWNNKYHVPIFFASGDLEINYTWFLYYQKTGNTTEAEKHLLAALKDATENKVNIIGLRYLKALMQWYIDRGDIANTGKYYGLYSALTDTMDANASANNVAYYEHEMKENEARKNIAALREEGIRRDAQLQSKKKVLQGAYLALGLAVLLAAALFAGYRQKTKANRSIAAERNKSDALLLNILPAEVAEELKEKGQASAKLYNNVTVLFTDFVNFTHNAEHMDATELVGELNTCFKAFDEIMGKYGIEKIKTIGDAYLAVAGLPTQDEEHAAHAVRAALEIRDYMRERQARLGNKTFCIRIGVNSGNVVAGIVGVKKFAYDIWGDTVNIAARMEQNSVPGRINISETTYELVNDKFDCEYRGEIDAKGKGQLKMYFVNCDHYAVVTESAGLHADSLG